MLKLELGLYNYYGEVCLEQLNGKWYLSLSDYDVDKYVEISEEFAKAIEKEFNVEKQVIDFIDIMEEHGEVVTQDE